MEQVSPEHVFLRYAVPCAQILVTQGRISQEKLDSLKEVAFSGGEVPKEELAEIFHQAFRRLKLVAGEEFWNVPTIRRYFHDLHNGFIEDGEGNYEKLGPTFREMCKVHKVVIERMIIPEKKIAEVSVEGKKRPIFLNMLQDAKVGEEVYIHHSFAIERA